jgi:hypothetical protein
LWSLSRPDPDRRVDVGCYVMEFRMSGVESLGPLAQAVAGHAPADSKRLEYWRRLLSVNAVLEVQYEDGVADLETQARCILGYCRLE